MVAMREKRQQKPTGPGNDYIGSEAVANILGCSQEWVRKLRENGRLHSWKMKDDGTGWEPVQHTEGKRRQGKAATGGRVVFYKGEVEEYKRNYVPQPHAEPVDVSPSEEQLIIKAASEELESVGYVTRAKLLEKLINLSNDEWKMITRQYEGERMPEKPGERKLQRKIKTVADKHEWPYPPKGRKHQG